jgi:exopolysaccharide biosynthesis predicted pyruvyltransferase EpsI
MLENNYDHQPAAADPLPSGLQREDTVAAIALGQAAARLVRVVVRDADSPYLNCLRARIDKLFYRMPYPGNAGDSLIQFATDTLLKDLGIRTTVDPRAAEVILVPGGNPSMWHDIGAGHWQGVWAKFPQAEFMVGPAGFRRGYSDWARIINEHGVRVSGLFARDPDSFDTLRNSALRSEITIGLADDPALYLRESEWLQAHRSAATEEYVLAAFRDDHETDASCKTPFGIAHGMVPGRIHHMLARRQAANVRTRKLAHAARSFRHSLPLVCLDVSKQRFEVFVETIRAARDVHTDRLHVMLLAAMLGKKVYAYPTSHSKLEGVYHHSLAGWADVSLVTM